MYESKSVKERSDMLVAKDLIENLKSIYDIFGSTTQIHLKF